MMKKQFSHPIKKWSVLLLLPAFYAFFWAFAEPVLSAPEGDTLSIRKSKPNNGIDTLTVAAKGMIVSLTKKAGSPPAYFIDGKEVTEKDVQKIDPNIVKSLSACYSDDALALSGETGKNGIIKVETKILADSGIKVNKNEKMVINFNGKSALILIDGVKSSFEELENLNQCRLVKETSFLFKIN